MGRKLMVLAGSAAVAIGMLAGEAAAQRREVFLFNDHYFGINWTGWSIDAMANCRRDAAAINGGAFRATCTPTVYGARMTVVQII